MKQIISIIVLLCMSNLNIMAQGDSTYIGKFYNKEHKIFLKIDLVNKNIVVDDQTVFGEMDGYIGSDQCNHIWAIVSSEIRNGKAEIEVVNNYGSEDFQATLTKDKDNNLFFKHTGGSVLKFPVNRKWQKIPSKVLFVRQKP
ncbi:MAG: hypothetical protein IJ166_01375 [Prevotella sp.]|nr:hypothetical protein [Prevotella sp.]